MNDQTADVEAPPDPGRLLRTASIAAECVVIIVTAALYWSGVIGQVGFWRGLWAGTMLNLVSLLALVQRLSASTAQLAATVETLMVALQDIETRPALQCAGCHARVWLTQGSTADGFPLPPDWAMRNERPYCPSCLARG